MYQTSENYKQKVYADSTKHLLNIYIEGNLVNVDHIFDFKISHPLFSDDKFTLGSVTAKSIEMKIHKNSLPDCYQNFYVETGVEEEIVPIGYFTLESIEKNDDDTVTIKAIDDMIKFEFNYDGSHLNYPISIIEVLEDICSQAEVELGSTSFLNKEKQVAVYDNTLSAREYVSYIAEQAGGFALIGRDRKLYIKTIGENMAELKVELFQDYTWGESFKVSRIAYEDGIQNFQYGKEENNTVWINADNMYIVEANQIENIYNQLKDFECYSFEGKTITDPAFDIGDILVIDQKKVIYQGDMEYVGKFKVSLSSKIQAKQKEENTRTIISDKTKIRRVQSQIDQVEGTITQLVEESNEQDKKLTKVEQDLDRIKQTVESGYDLKRKIEGVTEIYIENAIEGEVLNLTIEGNKTYESNLFPEEDLYPQMELQPNQEVN